MNILETFEKAVGLGDGEPKTVTAPPTNPGINPANMPTPVTAESTLGADKSTQAGLSKTIGDEGTSIHAETTATDETDEPVDDNKETSTPTIDEPATPILIPAIGATEPETASTSAKLPMPPSIPSIPTIDATDSTPISLPEPPEAVIDEARHVEGTSSMPFRIDAPTDTEAPMSPVRMPEEMPVIDRSWNRQNEDQDLGPDVPFSVPSIPSIEDESTNKTDELAVPEEPIGMAGPPFMRSRVPASPPLPEQITSESTPHIRMETEGSSIESRMTKENELIASLTATMLEAKTKVDQALDETKHMRAELTKAEATESKAEAEFRKANEAAVRQAQVMKKMLEDIGIDSGRLEKTIQGRGEETKLDLAA